MMLCNEGRVKLVNRESQITRKHTQKTIKMLFFPDETKSHALGPFGCRQGIFPCQFPDLGFC
jgi:hypothetical protein